MKIELTKMQVAEEAAPEVVRMSDKGREEDDKGKGEDDSDCYLEEEVELFSRDEDKGNKEEEDIDCYLEGEVELFSRDKGGCSNNPIQVEDEDELILLDDLLD
jgi:hypothetical protein